MNKTALDTRLTYLKPLLKEIKSSGGKINRPSVDNVVKKVKNLKTPGELSLDKSFKEKGISDMVSVVTGPNYNPATKNINIPKLKSKEVASRTGIDTKRIADKLLNKNEALRSFNNSPEAVIAHEFGHFQQHKDKMKELTRRTRSDDYRQKVVTNAVDAIEKAKAEDYKGALKNLSVSVGSAKRSILGKTDDVLKTEGDASRRAMSTLTQLGTSQERLSEAGKALNTAMDTYKKNVKPLPEKVRKFLEKLPG